MVELRHKRLTQARIAVALGLSKSTVGRVLACAGLSRLTDLQPAEPVVRYEHVAPGDMLHIDTKKLGRIVRPSHRVTGNRKDSVTGAGWEMLFVAIDDHARIAFTDIHSDEKTPNAVQFLRNAHAYYASLGVRVQRLLTDNGAALRSPHQGIGGVAPMSRLSRSRNNLLTLHAGAAPGRTAGDRSRPSAPEAVPHALVAAGQRAAGERHRLNPCGFSGRIPCRVLPRVAAPRTAPLRTSPSGPPRPSTGAPRRSCHPWR